MKRLRASSFKVKRIFDMPVAPASMIESPWGRQSNRRSHGIWRGSFFVPRSASLLLYSKNSSVMEAQLLLQERKPWMPPADHPWKTLFLSKRKKREQSVTVP
jgi:hypothetical protein